MNSNEIIDLNKAQIKIDEFKFLIKNIKDGNYIGRLWSFLESNPIQSALQAINDTKTFYNKNDLSDFNPNRTLFEELEILENELADFLIENQKNSEVDAVIQEIVKSETYGFAALKRIVLETDKSEKKWCITPLPSLSDDPLFLIFSFNLKSWIQLTQVSKYHANHKELFKRLCLTLIPNLLDIYPELNKLNHDKIDWKAIYLDRNKTHLTLKLSLFHGNNLFKEGERIEFSIPIKKKEVTVKNINIIIKKHFQAKYDEVDLCQPKNITEALSKMIKTQFQLKYNSYDVLLPSSKPSKVIRKIFKIDSYKDYWYKECLLNSYSYDFGTKNICTLKKYHAIVIDPNLPNNYNIKDILGDSNLIDVIFKVKLFDSWRKQNNLFLPTEWVPEWSSLKDIEHEDFYIEEESNKCILF